jgi:hypothetical protein
MPKRTLLLVSAASEHHPAETVLRPILRKGKVTGHKPVQLPERRLLSLDFRGDDGKAVLHTDVSGELFTAAQLLIGQPVIVTENRGKLVSITTL